MDAQHRHELKQNELADWLTHLPQFCKKNSNYILGITIICVALITAPMFTRMRKQKEITQQTEITQSIQMLSQDVATVLQAPADDISLQTEALNTMLVNAENLLDKTSEIDNPNLAAMAQIKAAQAIRTQLHLNKTLDAEILETQIQKAQDAYQKAFENAKTPTLKAMAQFGLGLCSEELGQTEQAGEIYQQIVDNQDYQATVMPAQAQQRLDGLEENAEAFNFVNVPVDLTSSGGLDGPEAAEVITTEIDKTTEESISEAEESRAPLSTDETNAVSEGTEQSESTE